MELPQFEKILPRKRIEFEVEKTKAEVIERINKLISYSDYQRSSVFNEKEYDFVISKFYPYANSFKPVFCGKISENKDRSKIMITAKMNSFVEIILILLVIFSLLSFLSILLSWSFSSFKWESFPVFALGFVLIAILIFYTSINFQLKIIKGRLSY